MARRFIVKNNDILEISETVIEIIGSEVKHIQVLRHNINDKIVVNEYICKILEMKKNSIVLEKLELAPKQGEPNIDITLFMAMLKGDKMDYVIQKSVELGVKHVVPFISKNVVVKLDEKSKKKRMEKFQIIANEACKQCGRTDSVEISSIISFQDLVINTKNYESCIMAYEKESKSLKSIMTEINEKEKIHSIALIIGAEGGFDETEYTKLCNKENVYSVSLGNRILRAETASLNLLSIIQYELGN